MKICSFSTILLNVNSGLYLKCILSMKKSTVAMSQDFYTVRLVSPVSTAPFINQFTKLNTDRLPLITKQAACVKCQQVHLQYNHKATTQAVPANFLPLHLTYNYYYLPEACRHLLGSVWLASILPVALFTPEEQKSFY